MREEIRDWIIQGEADFRKAKILFEASEYDGVAFYSHQVIEKMLKALYMKNLKKSKAGHSIIHIAKELNVSENLFEKIKKINPEYLISRYPDIAGVAPVDYYSKDMVIDYISIAEEIIIWVKKQIGE